MSAVRSPTSSSCVTIPPRFSFGNGRPSQPIRRARSWTDCSTRCGIISSTHAISCASRTAPRSGTNALIERRCGTVAVVTTDGFRDLLEIGRQTRPRIYDVHLDNPPPLVPRELRYEVVERHLATGEVLRPLDESGLADVGAKIAAAMVDCVVVCFLHSHHSPAHETKAVGLLREMLGDDTQVIASSAVYPEFREYERFSTAVLNGALLTVMNAYLERLSGAAIAAGIRRNPAGQPERRRSDAARGCTRVSDPYGSVRSGGRRDWRGASGEHCGISQHHHHRRRRHLHRRQPRARRRDHVRIGRLLAGLPLRLPTIDVNAVGAGGGSIA